MGLKLYSLLCNRILNFFERIYIRRKEFLQSKSWSFRLFPNSCGFRQNKSNVNPFKCYELYQQTQHSSKWFKSTVWNKDTLKNQKKEWIVKTCFMILKDRNKEGIVTDRLPLHSMCAQQLLSGPTLCSPTDCCPPGSSVHGILQIGTLEWVAMPFSAL